MLRLRFVALATAMLILAVAVAAKKPRGKISDPVAFSKIQSYCVDSSALAGDEAYDLTRFVSNENKPKKLLSKLPWTLDSDCSKGDPDVVVTMEFQKFGRIQNNVSGQGDVSTIRAILRVSQGSSSQAIYEVEAAPTNDTMGAMSDAPQNDPLAVQRYNAVYSAFWMMIEDVQRVSQMTAK